MDIKIEGLERLIDSIEDIADIESNMLRAVQFIEGEARENANIVAKGTGALTGGMESKVEREGNEIVGTVYNTKFYAPYVEMGTGIYAVNGDGRQGGWYIPIGDDFTEAQAKKYHYPIFTGDNGQKFAFTWGSKPHPFLGPALRDNVNTVMRIIKGDL